MSDKIEVQANYDGGRETIIVDSIKEVAEGIRLRDDVDRVIGFVTYENLAYANRRRTVRTSLGQRSKLLIPVATLLEFRYRPG